MKRVNIILMIGALLLAALACSLPGQNSTETPEPVIPTDAPTEAITEEVTEAVTEAVTEEPTEEVYTCAAGMLPGIRFHGRVLLSQRLCYRLQPGFHR